MTIVNRSIDVKGLTIRAKLSSKGDDYISLTDIAKYKSERPAVTVEHWLRQYNTIEYLGVWEQLHNDNFKVSDFEDFKNHSGSNAFTLSPQKWISSTNAIGIVSKSGRYGGTFKKILFGT